jgi:hypothetical protein
MDQAIPCFPVFPAAAATRIASARLFLKNVPAGAAHERIQALDHVKSFFYTGSSRLRTPGAP